MGFDYNKKLKGMIIQTQYRIFNFI